MIVFLILSIILFILGGVVSLDKGDGEILGVNAIAFIAFGLASLAISFLPWTDIRARIA